MKFQGPQLETKLECCWAEISASALKRSFLLLWSPSSKDNCFSPHCVQIRERSNLKEEGFIFASQFRGYGPLWWLLLVVRLTTSGMNYNPDMEGKPVRDYFCLVWSEWTHSSPDLSGRKIHTFDLNLEWGRQTFNLGQKACIRTWKKGAFALCLLVLYLPAHLSLHWH